MAKKRKSGEAESAPVVKKRVSDKDLAGDFQREVESGYRTQMEVDAFCRHIGFEG